MLDNTKLMWYNVSKQKMKGKCKYMSNKLHYKGYTAEIYYSAEDNLIFGKLEGIKDLVNFHSDNTDDIVQHFHDAVDDYLEVCAEVDKEPEKPYMIEFNCPVCGRKI